LSVEALVTDYNAWSALRVTKQLPHPPTPRTFHYSDYPCLLSAEAKKRLILGKSKQHQIRAQHVALATAQIRGEGKRCSHCVCVLCVFRLTLYYSLICTTSFCYMYGITVLIRSISSSISAAVVHPFFVMYIDREKLLQTALQQIMTASDNDLIKPLRVVFVNEEAIDEGGVRKEFFQLLVAQLFSPDFGKACPTLSLCCVQSVSAILICRTDVLQRGGEMLYYVLCLSRVIPITQILHVRSPTVQACSCPQRISGRSGSTSAVCGVLRSIA
jgi:hypothetical protein